MRRFAVIAIGFVAVLLPICAGNATVENPEKIEVLILHKFENGK